MSSIHHFSAVKQSLVSQDPVSHITMAFRFIDVTVRQSNIIEGETDRAIALQFRLHGMAATKDFKGVII